MTSLWDCTGGRGSGTSGNIVVAATAPSSPKTNDLWFDLSTNAWKVYQGGNWIPVTGDPSCGAICSSINPPANPKDNDLWYDPALNRWTVFRSGGAGWVAVGGGAASGGIPVGATPPGAPTAGMVWVDITTPSHPQVKVYDSTGAWRTLLDRQALPAATAQGQLLVAGTAPGYAWRAGNADCGRY